MVSIRLMVFLGKSVAFCALLLCTASAAAQNQNWLPITQRDLRLKEVPGIPGAPAIQLYYADYIDDQEQTEFLYHRIKILNDKGIRYADVEIMVPEDGSITELKARTIHPDGKIIEFTGKAFQKVIFKDRGAKVLAKALTLPEATVGSIVEYKYKIQFPGVFLDNSWTIQHELYTVKEKLRMKPYGGLLEGFDKGHKVAALSSHVPENFKPKQKAGGYELDVDNMPPFEREGYMPPEEDYKPQIRFFYGGTEISNADKFWQQAGRRWNDEAERFMGRHREIAEEADRVIEGETDPLRKLRKLYARAQEIRNLTFERERTEQEERKEKLKPNQSVLDVLARGYGDREDVGRFFVALARAAGFDASILRVSDRRERFFDHGLLSRRQLDSEIALVNQDGHDIFLDPGTRFAPFGFVRWMHTSCAALSLDKDGGSFIKVPAAGYNEAMLWRSAEMVLDAAGSLQGTVTAKFEGGEALERRLDALATDEAGRKNELEEEAKSWLPGGASVQLLSAEGWEGSENPLAAVFAVKVPSYALAAGTRLLAPANLFRARELDVFKDSVRKYPIYFPYAFGEVDATSIQLPGGYRAEKTPSQSATLPYAAYQVEFQTEGDVLKTLRTLRVNGIFFQREIYPEIRDFFAKVQLGDDQHLVLNSEVTAKSDEK